MEKYFFIIFLSTILATRIFIFISGMSSPKVGKIQVHHYMYGIVFIAISAFVKEIILYSIGLGLFVDELFHLISGRIHEYKLSKFSIIGTIVFIILTFVFKNYLISII